MSTGPQVLRAFYAYECKYSGCRLPCKMMSFYLVGCYLDILMLQLMAGAERLCHLCEWGSRAYVIFPNEVARWKRLGTTALRCANRTTRTVTQWNLILAHLQLSKAMETPPETRSFLMKCVFCSYFTRLYI